MSYLSVLAAAFPFNKFQELFEDEDFRESYEENYYEGSNLDRDYPNGYAAFMKDIKGHLKMGTKGVQVYREVLADSLEDIDLTRLGPAWSYVKEGARAYHGGTKGKNFILVAEAPLSSVDLWTTLRQGLIHFDTERELRVEGKLFLFAIEDKKGNVIKKFTPPMKSDSGPDNMGSYTKLEAQCFLVRSHVEVDAGLKDILKNVIKKGLIGLVGLGAFTSIAEGRTFSKAKLDKAAKVFNESMEKSNIDIKLITSMKARGEKAGSITFSYVAPDGSGASVSYVTNGVGFGNLEMREKKGEDGGVDADVQYAAKLMYEDLKDSLLTEGIELNTQK